MLFSESLRPTEVNWITGGLTHETVKKEWGARLGVPSGASEDTHAIGRGMITAVSRR